jgi:hypothetical protein
MVWRVIQNPSVARLHPSSVIRNKTIFRKPEPFPDIHIFGLFSGEGPRSRRYGRTAAMRLIVQPCDEGDSSPPPFACNGAPMEWNWQGKTEVLWKKKTSPSTTLYTISPHGLNRDRTRASAVRSRRLTAWAMARPSQILALAFAYRLTANILLLCDI